MAHLSVSGLPGLDHSSELLASAGGQWAGGRPRQLGDDDEDFVIQTATTRPVELGQPFTRWSLRRLVAYLHKVHGRVISLGREALRGLLARRGVIFQRTKTWKESPRPEREMKLDRIEHILDRSQDRVFAFDEFGPLGIRPSAGSGWAEQRRPDRVPATYHRTHEVRYFHGCYSVGDDRLWGVNRRRKGAVNTLAALKSIRASPRPYASWANPVEAHFGPLRQFTIANSHHPNHTMQTQALVAKRKERTRIRSEKDIRWSGRPLRAAA